MYIISGVIFLIFLISLSLAELVQAVEVYPSINNPSYKYIFDDNSKIYVTSPVSWTLTEQTDGILLNGDNAKVYLSVSYPTLGTVYPSANTPIEQVANFIMSNSTNSKIIS